MYLYLEEYNAPMKVKEQYPNRRDKENTLDKRAASGLD